MKRKSLVYGASVGGTITATVILVACVDLFHGTSFQTLCDVDASAPGCGAAEAGTSDAVAPGVDAGSDAATDLCTMTSTEARATAAHACGWLGACEGPYEHNPFGQCVFEAIQAYDCTARPNMKVKGSVLEYWRCLANVKTCGDVDRCVYPGVTPVCSGTGMKFNACAGNGVTRVACSDTATTNSHPTFVANCNGQGRRCVQPSTNDSIAFCAASDTSDGGCTPGCEGSLLHDCEDAGLPYPLDLGRDCSNVGGGGCANKNGTVCAPSTSGTSCADAGALSCSSDGTTVIDCRSGIADEVSCAKLGGTCQTAGLTGPAWDPAYACLGPATCAPDSCGGSVLNGCANGIKFSVDCKAIGLSGCFTPQATPVGPDYDPTELRATCKP